MWGLAGPKTARQNGSRPGWEARLWLLSTGVRVPSDYYLHAGPGYRGYGADLELITAYGVTGTSTHMTAEKHFFLLQNRPVNQMTIIFQASTVFLRVYV